MAGGLVVSVELDAATPTLAEVLRGEPAADEDLLRRSLLRALASQRLHGEVLIGEFHVSPAVVGRALRQQLAARLQALEELADARVCFRVTIRPPRGANVRVGCSMELPARAARFLARSKEGA
jgi:hypothetical protein